MRVQPRGARHGGLVMATPVKNKAGYVYSPFVEGSKMVDVRKFRAGQQALCPYSMEKFIVPGATTLAAPPVVPSLRPTAKPEPVIERGRSWGRLVVATPVKNKSGYVYSPHADGKRMVDVRKFRAGDEVLCPYTMRRFVVPDERLVRVNAAELEREQAAVTRASLVPLGELPMIASTSREVPSSMNVPRQRPVENASPVRVANDLGQADGGQPIKVEPPKSSPIGRTLPAGSWVEGRPGFVISPYGKSYQLVDVTGIAPGTEVKCPYTGKNFVVPGLASAPGAGASQPQPKPQPTVQPKVEPKTEEEPTSAPVKPSIPTASWSTDSPGYVQSPFGKTGQLVDVTGFSAGTVVECPFTHKDFLVPQAKGSE